MSIYINGIDIPQDGIVRVIMIESDGSIRFYGGSSVIARAVQLPPHGRCIDADAMAAIDNEDYKAAMDTAFSDSSRALFDEIHRNVQNSITNAETIIPADPEGGADG